MKKIKIMIIIITIIIIILITSLLLINHSSNEVSNNNFIENIENSSFVADNNIINDINEAEIPESQDVVIVDKNIKQVRNSMKFYTVSNCIQLYINNITDKNNILIYNILDEDYINSNGITIENVLDHVGNYKQLYDFIPLQMNVLEGINTEIYAVYGKMIKRQSSGIGDDIFFIVKLCKNNLTFKIYPLNNYSHINQIKLENDDKTIEENEYNVFSYYRITDEELIRKYISNFKLNVIYNTSESYNMLDESYREKKFGDIEQYKKYINENINYIRNSILKSYNVYEQENIIYYDYVDNYNNHYIFKETATMQYTVFLDDYTILTGESKKQYDELDKYSKSKYNLANFIKMVNTKDYNAIYNVLDATFRKNNFKTQENLKQFIEENMYDMNSIEIKDVDNETYEYYIFKCQITNLNNEDESKDMIIIINQGEETNFTMSFSFNS